MIEREKVIQGIECCMRENNTNMCGDCPYHDSSETRFGCMRSAMRDALALLKEQEARVMTREEIVLCTDWVWVEYTSGYQGWYKIEEYDTDYGFIRWEDTTADMVDDYGFRWRAWTFRPTEEQRKAVPWDD